MRVILALLFMIVQLPAAVAQYQPIGQWQAHVPYQSAFDVAVTGSRVWGALEASLIAVDRDDLSITRYTRATGLSDVEPVAIAWDDSTRSIIVAYSNANVDIISGNTIVNVPDIKNALITGDKSVNAIYTHAGTAWLATGFGIVKINIADAEISDTYFVGVGGTNLQINDIWANDNFIFAATAEGVLRGTISPFINLADSDNPNAWLRFNFEDHMIQDQQTEAVDVLNDIVYAFQGGESLSLPINETTWTTVSNYPGVVTTGSHAKNGLLYFCQELRDGTDVLDAWVGTWDGSNLNIVNDNGQVSRPMDIDADPDGTIWYGDLFAGLSSIRDGGFNRYVANGPYKRTVMGMAWYNGAMYVASSSMSFTLPASTPFLPYGFYVSTDQIWTNYNEFNVDGLIGISDVAVIEPIPAENKLLIGAHLSGILEFDISSSRVTGFMETAPGESSAYRTIAMATDAVGNIWFPNAYATSAPLAVRRPGGQYLYFTEKTASILNQPINGITIDDFGQIWLSTAGDGVFVYNYGGTLEDQSDDAVKFVGSGFNLPSVDVRCLATDQDGEIWIGTTGGIGVVFCPGAIFNNNCIVDRICIPRQDTTNFCDNLLENEVINCITIDPANRKWIGTNRGVFLQSADGLETIRQFTVDNSPLLSNNIRSIAINEDNGDVFIGTDKGINTYRGDATFTDPSDSDAPFVYPNPVRPDYSGPIAIRNLPNNASVKILDTAGFLVYETRSEGGQATWDGRNVNGDRVQTGVYIVLSSDENGDFKRTTKFVYIR